MLTKEQILSKTGLQTQAEQSELFGGELCLQELSRVTFRAVVKAAKTGSVDENGEETVDTERWNGGLFAAIVVDPETKQPLFTLDEILAFSHRVDVWAEVFRIAKLGLELSEIGPEALKKTS